MGWKAEPRQRTRHLIILRGLVQKAALVGATRQLSEILRRNDARTTLDLRRRGRRRARR
jgi:hypothetical protein